MSEAGWPPRVPPPPGWWGDMWTDPTLPAALRRPGPPVGADDGWTVWFPTWIVGDGQRGDIGVGCEVDFALDAEAQEAPVPADGEAIRAVPLHPIFYEVTAVVREDGLVDFGHPAHLIDWPETERVPGTRLRATVRLGLRAGFDDDPPDPDALADVLRWRVERIEEWWLPLDGFQGDLARAVVHDVRWTRASREVPPYWMLGYVLHVRRADGEARREIRPARCPGPPPDGPETPPPAPLVRWELRRRTLNTGFRILPAAWILPRHRFRRDDDDERR